MEIILHAHHAEVPDSLRTEAEAAVRRIAARLQDIHSGFRGQRMRCCAHSIAGIGGRSAGHVEIAHEGSPFGGRLRGFCVLRNQKTPRHVGQAASRPVPRARRSKCLGATDWVGAMIRGAKGSFMQLQLWYDGRLRQFLGRIGALNCQL